MTDKFYRISDLYPDVESIRVDYVIEHKSDIPVDSISGTLQLTGQSAAEISLRCPNRECTRGEIDIYSEVMSVLCHRETEASGKKHCNGLEARDHPGQPCASEVSYHIRVRYHRRGLAQG